MRLPCLAATAVLALTGCGGTAATEGPDDAPAPAGFPSDVRDGFLASCVANARNTASEQVAQEQLVRTCDCLLGKVEQDFSASGFADFERRLLGGQASTSERAQLRQWSTSCATEEAS